MESSRISSRNFGLCIAVGAALFWGVYSAGVLLQRIVEVYLGGFYGYTDLNNYEWKPELTDFFAGLLACGLAAGLSGWLIASVYNLLNDVLEPKLR
jgi:hypothetical protein